MESITTQLPVDGSDLPEILALGIVFGDVTPGDSIFRMATLPEGWRLESVADSIMSYVVDNAGRRRAAVFYKEDPDDRFAFLDFFTNIE